MTDNKKTSVPKNYEISLDDVMYLYETYGGTKNKLHLIRKAYEHGFEQGCKYTEDEKESALERVIERTREVSFYETIEFLKETKMKNPTFKDFEECMNTHVEIIK